MRVVRSIEELEGINHNHIPGITLVDTNARFVTKGVDNTCTLYNETTQESATVTAVTEDTIEAGTLQWQVGDLYRVSLKAPYTVRTNIGPVIDVECKRCGFSCESNELIKGYCQDCYDEPRRQ